MSSHSVCNSFVIFIVPACFAVSGVGNLSSVASDGAGEVLCMTGNAVGGGACRLTPSSMVMISAS
ncbi:MAG: hypothetical protein OEW08_14440 [Gammaproteobacteria bacterium]|nr:hypothetical protein [Gammaproteobacteria bacterium]